MPHIISFLTTVPFSVSLVPYSSHILVLNNPLSLIKSDRKDQNSKILFCEKFYLKFGFVEFVLQM